MAWPKGKTRPPGSGRKKGTPNKATTEVKSLWAAVLEKRMADVDRWLQECADGIEIEKTLADGTTVNGRMNADPGRALGVMLQITEYFHPKLARVEKGINDASDEELLQEIQRRRSEREAAK